MVSSVSSVPAYPSRYDNMSTLARMTTNPYKAHPDEGKYNPVDVAKNGQQGLFNLVERYDYMPDDVREAFHKAIDESGFNPYRFVDRDCSMVSYTAFETLALHQHLVESSGAGKELWVTLDDVPAAVNFAQVALTYIHNPSQCPLPDAIRDQESAFFKSFLKNLGYEKEDFPRPQNALEIVFEFHCCMEPDTKLTAESIQEALDAHKAKLTEAYFKHYEQTQDAIVSLGYTENDEHEA